ncbi:MAG: hypothetical protein A2V98_04735 [Planctomycetes bacterium RBG_16_64_12]|nr:MAG: hypothetical protein A2V98_04735 [Planctomycetes bacterium RBG_16_64_12]
MRFAPKPENDFACFIRTYYVECRHRFDKIEAIAGKWMFRDLIPGLSDFDARLIVSNAMTADDWCRMSTAVGGTHLALCRKCPAWARKLEHLPGINLTWQELLAERTYYPEYQQWSFYDCEVPGQAGAVSERLGRRGLDAKDELFHLKRFCTYFGRYNRTIDPAINMGVQANKYPLHSRLMHYFTPPLHSAMFLLENRPFVGKFEALEMAAARFAELECWDHLWEILAADYMTPKWYEEPYLTELEDALEDGLAAIRDALRDVITLVPRKAGIDVTAWKKALARAPADPVAEILDNARFSRMMKGRLQFYADAPPHFDTTWLIRNELGRIGQSFFVNPFRVFWKTVSGQMVDDPLTILPELRGGLLSSEEVEAVERFHRLTVRPCAEGKEKEAARAIAGVFDGFFHALSKIHREVLSSRHPKG